MNENILDCKLDSFKRYLEKMTIPYRNDYVIKYDTHFKMGGVVKIFVCPKITCELKDIVRYLSNAGLTYKIIGFTTNILFLDNVQYSIIISTKNLVKVGINNCYINVDSGYSLQDFVRIAVIEGSCGFEGLEGIPGTIGGAVVMNAGAYGHEISDNLISVECVTEKGEFKTLSREECEFSYRDSKFKKEKHIILSAKFIFKKGDKKLIEKNIERYHIARHSYQEFVYPNLGSLFSVRRGIYYELFKNGFFSRTMFYIFKVIFKNPASKFIFRKRPNNSGLNWLSTKYIQNLNLEPSIKNMNIIINDGKSSIEDVVEYIFILRSYLDESIKVENEVVLEPIYSIPTAFEPIYDEIKSKVQKVERTKS